MDVVWSLATFMVSKVFRKPILSSNIGGMSICASKFRNDYRFVDLETSRGNRLGKYPVFLIEGQVSTIDVRIDFMMNTTILTEYQE